MDSDRWVPFDSVILNARRRTIGKLGVPTQARIRGYKAILTYAGRRDEYERIAAIPRLVLGRDKQGMENPPPSLDGSTDSSAIEIGKGETKVMNQVKRGKSSSKLAGKKRRNLELEAKIILKQWKKVKRVAEKVAHMRAEARSLRAETVETVAAADEKEKEVKFEKEKRDGSLAVMLLMSGTEHVLMDALFSPSGSC